MRVVDAIVQILKREGVEFLTCYPTGTLIEAAAIEGVRPIVCRQERVGVGIADGFTRISNGRRTGVFTMQSGPGSENAFSGIATAYSDSVPMLVLPVGYPRSTSQVHHYFKSVQSYAPITKSVEQITLPSHTCDVMRRAFSRLKMGRPGPVLVEIPVDLAVEEFNESDLRYATVKRTVSGANSRDISEAARVLVDAKCPVIVAGQGVLYAEASNDLVDLGELLQAPVTTTLEGKSAFPETNPLSLGTGAGVMPLPVYEFLKKADVIFAIGASLTRYNIVAATIPAGKTIIHATNDESDINKHYVVDYPILGDAKPVLRQFVEAVKDIQGKKVRNNDASVSFEIARFRQAWLGEWMPKLTSKEVPINPYRVFWEFMRTVDAREAIITHDSGSPRNQVVPFYQAPVPRSYIGWGKSHALGTGLGLMMGAKLAAPDKFCVNFMGDAAFGMTGLDFETAVRCNIPILTVVLNNNFMAVETPMMARSQKLYGTQDIGGNYADIGRALGGWAEKVEDPDQISGAFKRARKATEDGKAALLEFITSREHHYSAMRD